MGRPNLYLAGPLGAMVLKWQLLSLGATPRPPEVSSEEEYFHPHLSPPEESSRPYNEASQVSTCCFAGRDEMTSVSGFAVPWTSFFTHFTPTVEQHPQKCYLWALTQHPPTSAGHISNRHKPNTNVSSYQGAIDTIYSTCMTPIPGLELSAMVSLQLIKNITEPNQMQKGNSTSPVSNKKTAVLPIANHHHPQKHNEK